MTYTLSLFVVLFVCCWFCFKFGAACERERWLNRKSELPRLPR